MSVLARRVAVHFHTLPSPTLPISRLQQHQPALNRNLVQDVASSQMNDGLRSILKIGVGHFHGHDDLTVFPFASHRCTPIDTIELPGVAQLSMDLKGRARKCGWGHRRARGGMKGRRAK
mmetsp:Transcript_123230/g.195430  ORF Transcript_123230/g.195430 Transcript_123230/m.195430 type:complete len:119 (-) Transcript_123230:59-415(-)